MTKLEIMQLVKECPDKTARGIDPLTGREVPEGEVFTGKQNSVQIDFFTVVIPCQINRLIMMLRFLRFVVFFYIGDKRLICLFYIHRGNTSLRVQKKLTTTLLSS